MSLFFLQEIAADYLFPENASPAMEGIIHFHNSMMIMLSLIGFSVLIFVWLIILNFYLRINYFYLSDEFSFFEVFEAKAIMVLVRRQLASFRNKFLEAKKLEVGWTVAPPVVLASAFIPSLFVISTGSELVDADLTIKATGNQWYWNYEYSIDEIRYNEMESVELISKKKWENIMYNSLLFFKKLYDGSLAKNSLSKTRFLQDNGFFYYDKFPRRITKENVHRVMYALVTEKIYQSKPHMLYRVYADSASNSTFIYDFLKTFMTLKITKALDVTKIYRNLPVLQFDSYMVDESTLSEGELRLLEVDEPLVVPVNKRVRFVITSKDVLHSFAVPSLGVKIDAVPGRLNEISVLVERPGVYYGQCSELCGVNHGYMPIKIVATDNTTFIKWYLSKLDQTLGLDHFYTQEYVSSETAGIIRDFLEYSRFPFPKGTLPMSFHIAWYKYGAHMSELAPDYAKVEANYFFTGLEKNPLSYMNWGENFEQYQAQKLMDAIIQHLCKNISNLKLSEKWKEVQLIIKGKDRDLLDSALKAVYREGDSPFNAVYKNFGEKIFADYKKYFLNELSEFFGENYKIESSKTTEELVAILEKMKGSDFNQLLEALTEGDEQCGIKMKEDLMNIAFSNEVFKKAFEGVLEFKKQFSLESVLTIVEKDGSSKSSEFSFFLSGVDRKGLLVLRKLVEKFGNPSMAPGNKYFLDDDGVGLLKNNNYIFRNVLLGLSQFLREEHSPKEFRLWINENSEDWEEIIGDAVKRFSNVEEKKK